jgi:hypothetical protein
MTLTYVSPFEIPVRDFSHQPPLFAEFFGILVSDDLSRQRQIFVDLNKILITTVVMTLLMVVVQNHPRA